MTKANLKTWESLAKTDPAYMKSIGGGPLGAAGFSSIDPMWRWQRLTEEYGPCGEGWRYSVAQHGVEDGIVWVLVELFAGRGTPGGEKKGPDGTMTYFSGVGPKPIPAFGAAAISKHKDESWKCALTDALGKAASMLGLCADVYLGEHDGDKYTATAKPKGAGEAVTPREAESLIPPTREAVEDTFSGAEPVERPDAGGPYPPGADGEYRAAFDKITWSTESWGETPHCPYCNDFIYDNREHSRGGTGKFEKKNPRAPDFKHKKGADCTYVLWPSGEWSRG